MAQVFSCEFCEIKKKKNFFRTLQATASVISNGNLVASSLNLYVDNLLIVLQLYLFIANKN